MTLRYEVVELDAPNRFTVCAETALLRSVDILTFDPTAAGGCIVTYDADLTLKGVLRVANPVLGVVFARIGDRAATGLRDVLDGTEA